MKFRTTSLGMKQKKLLVTLLAACLFTTGAALAADYGNPAGQGRITIGL